MHINNFYLSPIRTRKPIMGKFNQTHRGMFKGKFSQVLVLPFYRGTVETAEKFCALAVYNVEIYCLEDWDAREDEG